jgi:WD40 repeat protein
MENQPNSQAPVWAVCPDINLQINSVDLSDDGSRCVFGTSFERGEGLFHTYLYDGNGNQLWAKPISSTTAYQGVYWVAISGDGRYVASGGETSKTQGYLQAYQADTGELILNETPASRINQVSLSLDGQYLAVCYDKTVAVYQLSSDTGQYSNIASFSDPDYEINSCVISRDGSTVIASGIKYTPIAGEQDKYRTTGQVYSYAVSGSQVTSLGTTSLNTGSMRVAVVDDGSHWTASLHDGSCVLINREKPDTTEWQCAPKNPDIMLAYAVDICKTPVGDVYVACGANQNNPDFGGYLYLVKSTRMVYEQAEGTYPPPYFSGVIHWSQDIQFGVNPGVSLDLNATFVTATDGKPDGQTVVESAGSFYLFDATSGEPIWRLNTAQMNWPMKLARNASCVVGASDAGSFYYWLLNAS